MSFSQTSSQVRERMKTVTRRPGWRFLKPNDLILAVESAQRLEKGEPVRALAVLRILDIRIEPLSRLVEDASYAEDELPREGFPCWSRDDFITKFMRAHRLTTVETDVTRIEFEYVDTDVPPGR
jgi:hypothetical protein